MSVLNLLKDLGASGITLNSEDGSLKVHAPKGSLTPELRERLVAHRDALLAHLAESDDDATRIPECVPDVERAYEPFPMSDLQLGFYMADDPYMDFHVRPHYYVEKEATGIDPVRYEAAWNKALERHRHEIPLVRPEGDLQIMRSRPAFAIPVLDMSALPEDEALAALASVRAGMMRSELPLDRWPWLDVRVSLWRADGIECARVHCNFNNFFVDGFGTTRLLQEVDGYYRNPDLVLPPLALGFRDAVLALDKLAASQAGQAARRYWEDRLPALPGPPDIPMAAGVDRRCRSRLNRRKHAMDAGQWSQFKVVARQFGLTPSNALFAVYAEVLAAWSNSRHFVLSNMMTRRTMVNHPEIRDIAGNFASLYPLEVDLRTGASFVERACRLQEQVIRDVQCLQWGGMQVLQALNRIKGSFGRAPIPFVVGSGLFMEAFDLDGFSCLETSQVMLDFQFFEAADGRLRYVWDVLEEFFPAGLIDDMWSALATLVSDLASDPAMWKQASFHLIPARHLAERAGVQPAAYSLTSGRLDDLLRHSARTWSKNAALVMPDRTLSYRELSEGAARLASLLRRSGVRRGDTVAVVLHRGPDLLVAVHGILKAGAAYVPVDPALPEERRRYLLEDSGARHVITDPSHAQGMAWPDGICVLTTSDATGPFEDEALERGHEADLAYVIYTSGSTGRPKGVMIDHIGALNTVRSVNERFGIGAGDRLFGVSSFGFDLSVYDIFGAAAAGATLIYPEPQRVLDPAHWLDALSEQRVTVWNSAPPLAALLIELAEYRGTVLPDLRLVMLSGDWIPVDLPDRIRKVAPQAQVVSLGGATEASIWSIWYPIGAVDPAWSSIPYGYPMPNQSWCVLDDWGRPAPEWTAGELYIGGIGLAKGYRNDPGKTAAAFITHPHTGERLYRTGDIGRYLPGGLIEFLGRRDTQVKIQGHRIELGEVESVLVDCPGVSSAVAVVQRERDGSNAQLAVHLVAQSGATPSVSDMQAFLSRKLPAYMVPRLFNFVPALPLNSNGKVDRQALPRIEEQRAPVSIARRLEPLDDVEAKLLAIWRQVLQIDDLAVTDDFFDLGGQSFQAVRVVGLIREVFKKSVSIGDIWEHRSVASLAGHLRAGDAARAAHCLIELSQGTGRPLFLVHPAGGHVLCYRGLAEGLKRPVHAFQAPGVNGRELPLDSIPAFAARYLAELQAKQPEGPVTLGGWSSGGLIAYEMAVQLRALGRQVDGVIVFDSPAPLVHEPVSDELLFHWFIADLDLDEPARQALGNMDLGGMAEAERLTSTAACLLAHGIDLGADLEQFGAIYRVFKGIVQGGRNYHAAPADVAMLILRARHGEVPEFQSHPFAGSPEWGWQLLASGGVSSMDVDATHYNLLAAPVGDQLVQAIERWLDRQSTSLALQFTGVVPHAEVAGQGV